MDSTNNEWQIVHINSQAGNIIFAIFGAVALVGLLGIATMTFMKGPLSSAVKMTKQNSAETQMAIGAQIAVISSASLPGNGDCDSDMYVEPMEWRAATTEPIPVNGGLIPLGLGARKMDPWGTEYGYCVWNHGALTSGSGCGANMLGGTNNSAYPVVALISAGPDKTFTTTCRSFSVADANGDADLDDVGDSPLLSKASDTDDDIIQTFTYEEASSASGGLWDIKSGDVNTAVIGKKIESTGAASLQGGILLPDSSSVTCDATTAGVMAKNASGTDIEICDGAGNWVAITGGVSEGLEFSPNTTTTMDVSGTCGNPTCYSTNVTFTLTNNITPPRTSQTLSVMLTNLDNFEFVSNTCGGAALATGASCTVVVRAKSMSNMTYSGKIRVIGNNSPEVSLNGTASGFPACTAGSKTKEGYFVGCGIGTAPNTYDLIITPSGCTGGVINPTCPGGNDNIQMSAASWVPPGSISSCCASSGVQNTVNLMAYVGATYPEFPAAAYCSSLVYKGYSDWFLPSLSEMQTYAYPNRASIGYRAGVFYWTSSGYDLTNATQISNYRISTNTSSYGDYSNSFYVRCMRRNPTGTVTPIADTTPHSAGIVFVNSTGIGVGEIRTSNPIRIQGVTSAVSISVSGGTSSAYSVNGGAYTSSAGTVSNGDIVTLRATSPAQGVQDTVSLTVGTYTWTWKVRTAGNNILRVFTTSTTYNGLMGGISGADANCNSLASSAGLGGTWVAVMVNGPYNMLEDRIPWNWNKLINMNGSNVASGINDFLDGSISAPMNYTEAGTLSGSSLVWTGIDANGIGNNIGNYGNSYNQCLGWVTATSGYNGTIGDSSLTNYAGYLAYGGNYTGCSNSYRLLCMESTPSAPDLDPIEVPLTPQVVFSSGGTGTSNTVTITGITDSVSVSMSPSSGTADIIKNGVSVGGTTTTVGLNETLAFTLTAPSVIGTKNTATITIGTDTYNWWVGYGDSTKDAKVFVTSIGYRGDLLGGLSGADAVCETRAAASPYGLSAKWKAIISDSTDNAANRISWSWKNLKTVQGTTIVDNGLNDLFDGTLDSVLVTDEMGGNASGQKVWTGTTIYGTYDTTGVNLSCSNWSAAGYYNYAGCGIANGTGATWTTIGSCNSNYCSQLLYRLYCVEDIDNPGSDTTPSNIEPVYAIQVPVSTRQSSASIAVSGLSIGATATLSVTATGGNPKFTVNGGGETDSATVQNGDVIIFKLDSPATGSSSYKMTITANGSTTLGYWRVWTGDTTGSATKRIFILPLSSPTWQGNWSLATNDSKCNSAATSAGIGGTWKSITSGINESEWAINRVGYDWTTLQRTDGVPVVMAGNLWSTETMPLLNPVIRNANNTASYSTSAVFTNTKANGKALYTTNAETCSNWTFGSYGGANRWSGTSNVTDSKWLSGNGNDVSDCYNGYYATYHLYCIEQ